MWYIENVSDTLLFKGSLIEVCAQLAFEDLFPFMFLVEVGAGLFDPSIALLLFIGSHVHSLESDCKDFCPLQRLIELGADPNLKGYRVTPLQIAVFCDDYERVEMLLNTGARPDDTGCPDGVDWREDAFMDDLDCLHGFSPLHICSDFPITDRRAMRKVGVDGWKKIEALLLCRGAKAFSTQSSISVQESETIIEGGTTRSGTVSMVRSV